MYSNSSLNNFKTSSYTYRDDLGQLVTDIHTEFNAAGIPFVVDETIEENNYYGHNRTNLFGQLVPQKREEQISCLLPPGLLYLDKSFLIFERPPTNKLINCYSQLLDNIDEDTRMHSYYLPIPWQVYLVEFDPNTFRTCSVKMFFSKGSIFSFEQNVYLPPIPNFYVNGQLCRPFFNSMDDIERYPQNAAGVIESAYDWVWASNFNLDLTETISSIYTQKNPIQIQRGHDGSSYTGYRLSMAAVNDTYSHWESFTISEVSSFDWPNPAFNQTFQEDEQNLDHHELFVRWCEENDIDIEDDEDYDNYYHSDSFRETLPKARSTPKTLQQIIDYSVARSSFPVVREKLENMLISYSTKHNNT